ncbi:MAG: hypothetical protein EBU08_19300 [Micrococcales bacterium]|nr:hypothetical protein [Micrococcales bacterium]
MPLRFRLRHPERLTCFLGVFHSQELDDQDDDDPIIEVNEHEFLKAEGNITYERHTKAENGVSQICLTKGLEA